MVQGVDVDVVVVGAGFAGLNAAARVVAAGRSVCVVEARDRVGGRTKPGTLAGHVVDLGGQWVGPDHRRLIALAARHPIPLEPQFEAGAKLIDYRDRVRRYEGLIPALPILALLETDRVKGGLHQLFERLADEVGRGRLRRKRRSQATVIEAAL